MLIYSQFCILLFIVANDLDGSPKGGAIYIAHLALGLG